MNRKIIHIDMDCFYAAVEMRDNPRLKGLPVAVGGSVEGRGVLTTANYEARKFGLRSAMPTSQALKLCPQVVLVPVNFSKYRHESKKIHSIFKKYTDKIEPLSLDEAYLDVTTSKSHQGSATLIAQAIRHDIFTETGLTASAGIASNKFLAKVASDWRKPNGQLTVSPERSLEFATQLLIGKIPGVGKVTQAKMKAQGIETCLDLQKRSRSELEALFGEWGHSLFDLCRGVDNRPVQGNGPRKSISVEFTFGKDLETLEEIMQQLPRALEQLEGRLSSSGDSHRVKSIFVKLKFKDFQTTTVEKKEFAIPTMASFKVLIEEAFNRQNKAVRLLGLGVRLKTIGKRKRSAGQMLLFS